MKLAEALAERSDCRHQLRKSESGIARNALDLPFLPDIKGIQHRSVVHPKEKD